MKTKIYLTEINSPAARLFAALALCLSICFTVAAQQQRTKQPSASSDIPAGYELVDGDMILRSDFVCAAINKTLRGGDAVYDDNFWTNAVIPFQFESTCAATSSCPNAPPSGCVSLANRTAMIQAMAELEAISNVDFQQCANNNCPAAGIIAHLRIRDTTNDTTEVSGACVDNSRNNSSVGMQGGQQIVNIVNWNERFVMAHELMHALGVYHEQSRNDRDTYVQINCNNVRGGCSGNTFTVNFTIQGLAERFGYYDFDSVMHYGQCDFSNGANCPADGSRTIVVKPPYAAEWQNRIGNRDHLSEMDKAIVGFLYPRPNWRFYNCGFSIDPGSGTFADPYRNQFITAYNNTPVGGTLWTLGDCLVPAAATYSKNITLRAAPGKTVSFGN